MLSRFSPSDTYSVYCGVALLAAIIIFGVAAAEYQLNHLTKRQDCVEAFNIRRDPAGYYDFFLLGQSLRVKAVYPVAAIANTDRSLSVAAGDRRLTVPTVISVDLATIAYWTNEWGRQFVAAARQTGAELTGYAGQLKLLGEDLADILGI